MKTIIKNVLFLLLNQLLVASLLYADQSEEFVVGATLPLSGDLSYVGREIVEGLELYLDTKVPSDCRRIKVIYDDNKHQGNLAASSAQSLLEIKKVNLIITLWDMADVVAPIAEKYRVPHIAIRAIPEVTKLHRFTITFESTAESYVVKEIDFLKRIQAETLAIITEEAKGWNVINSNLISKLKALNISLLSHETLSKESISNQMSILKVLKNKPDIILIHANNPLTEQIVKFIKLYAPEQKFSGYLENIPNRELVLNVPFIASYNPATWFEHLFFRKYNKPAITRGAHAYDIGHLICTSLSNVRDITDGAGIINALINFHYSNGASGRLFSSAPRVIENEVVFRVFNQAGSRTIDMSEATTAFWGQVKTNNP